MNEGVVTPEKKEALRVRMDGLKVREADLEEKFILGSGHGGQKMNKSSSCVYLRHEPSGLEVKCGQSRHRELNRYLARRELCDRLEARILGASSARRQAAEKVRRQKRRRSRRQRQHVLDDKRHHAEKKRVRASAPMAD